MGKKIKYLLPPFNPPLWGERYLLLFFFVLFTFICNGQNLVINPGFDIKTTGCPKFNESINLCAGWIRSKTFSADYFHRCVPPNQRMNLGVPHNMFGYQEARSGDAYAGISFTNEALVSRLIRPMVKDSIYKIEFFVNLSDSSNVGTRYLDMYISNRELRYRTDSRNLISNFLLDHPPQIQNPRDRYLIDTENWTSISGTYIAKGGEQYIAIGGFYPYHDSIVHVLRSERTLKKSYRDWEKHVGYYYVDDVSIIPIGMNWQTNIYYVLRYVFFDFDEIELVSESVDELTRLSDHLKKFPTYNINIKGHTDDFGTDEYNSVLSLNRAEAVVDWLINVGNIDPIRITYSGAGRHEPIADNETEEGRSFNRRVEFILTDTESDFEIRSM